MNQPQPEKEKPIPPHMTDEAKASRLEGFHRQTWGVKKQNWRFKPTSYGKKKN
jgi:hypothetical protein